MLYALLARSAGSLVGQVFQAPKNRTARDKLHGTDLQYR